mmetsp:Transcript_16151/g.24598  ORF Transcript_16151/g.24598 Transcript_16151/m.24598 type:complete len:208 (-) Transcript_16151:1035-1658(-)
MPNLKRALVPICTIIVAASKSHAYAPCSSMTSGQQWGVVHKVHDNKFRLFMKDDGTFPNNENHPLMIYKNCFHGSQSEAEMKIVEGGWTSPWVWGVFTFHHYHSTAWELLLCVQGEAQIQLGGPSGPTIRVERGDLMLVPPGFAHKQLSERGGFALLGAYPDCQGVNVDTLKGKPSDQQRRNILDCPTPHKDPISEIVLSTMYNNEG